MPTYSPQICTTRVCHPVDVHSLITLTPVRVWDRIHDHWDMLSAAPPGSFRWMIVFVNLYRTCL